MYLSTPDCARNFGAISCGTSTLSTSPLHSSVASFINGAPEGWRRLTQRRINGAYFCGSLRKSCASCGERMMSLTRVGAKLRRMARCAARNGLSSTNISEEKKTDISSPALLAVTRSRVKCPLSSCAAPSSKPSHCCATVRHLSFRFVLFKENSLKPPLIGEVDFLFFLFFEGHFICRCMRQKKANEMPKVGTTKP